jgi:ATP-dependent Clp protease ATP-binding subunit ClpC
MIKPSLARGEICCIGATTHAEYKKYFEKDGALKRRFEAINVDEPNQEQTKKIMMSSKKSFEEFHEVSFSEEMINNLIYLCDKYMPYRKFPDKAFDVLDTVSSKVKIKNFKMPQSLVSLEKKIKKDLENMDNKAVRVRCEDMIASYSEKLFEWAKKDKKSVPITLDDLITVFADRLKINKNKIVIAQNSEDEQIARVMKENVFGQDEAMEKLSDILICARAGLKDKKKPLAKFLFIGPTGVGKTWTAKLLAEKFFGNEKLLLKLDMSEYQEASSINKLIGSTIGYIGCEEGGILTEFVRNHPNCVVLFDEIEKANREINSILLQIMDDGCITDSLGRRIDFTNTIIILTGNIGQEETTMKPSMGFNSVVEKQEDVYKKAVERFFKPEFLARLDEVVSFKKISNKEFHKILETMIEKTKALLLEQGRTIEIEEGIFDLLLKIIEKEGSNARAIQKIYRKNFEINLAKFLCENKSSIISAKINKDEVTFEAA